MCCRLRTHLSISVLRRTRGALTRYTLAGGMQIGKFSSRQAYFTL